MIRESTARPVVLEARHLFKSFPGVQALADVSLEVRAGEVHVVMGENGAGKSTLMKVLSGVEQPDQDEIRLKGQVRTFRDAHDAITAGISMIHQELMPFPELTVAENIFIGQEPTAGIPGWIARRTQADDARQLLTQLGVVLSPNAKMRELSISEMQVVEIAKALAQRAEVLIMNEPTSALSAQEIVMLFRLIRDLQARGVAIIYISHKLEEVFTLANRVTVLRDGRYISTSDVAELDRHTLIVRMAGRELSSLFIKAAAPHGDEAIAVRGLTRQESFRNVSFAARRGEVLGITGYWGNPHHYYSTASMTSLPTHGAYGVTAADFNDDGRCDLLVCNYYQGGSYIYWGHADGFSTTHRQTVNVGSVLASKAVDLNRDGFLDLVFVGTGGGKNFGKILWGAAKGFDDQRLTVLDLKTQRSANVNLADLNHDGFVDLVFNDDYFGTMQIFWGNAEAAYTTDSSWFNPTSGGSLRLADLNGDGHLDFIISGGFDANKLSPNTKTPIFWGTPAGTPSTANEIELEAYQACEVAISDLNRDGHLDLVLGNYMSETTRSLPLFVYWGDKDGTYTEQRRLDLPAESSCGIQTLDLNRDGYPELIVHNHLKDEVHSINSYIYWNGPGGFDRDRRTEVPNFGPHYTAMTDPGHLYTRKLEEDYVSAPVELPAGKRAQRLAWKADEPHGAKLMFQVRSAATAADLERQAWRPADNGALDSVKSNDRWIQYRAVFTSPDAGSWPSLSEVEIQLK